jgi:hypothetical protein
MAVADGDIMPRRAASRNPEKRSITFHDLEKMGRTTKFQAGCVVKVA